jgi:hypothetical protein
MMKPVFMVGVLIFVVLAAGCANISGSSQNIVPAGTPQVMTTAPVTSAVPAPQTLSGPIGSSGMNNPMPGQLPHLLASEQPDETLSSYILMDDTVFVPGEVVAYHLYNRGPGNLRCYTQDPSYAVFQRRENGTWNDQSIISGQSLRIGELVMDVGDSTQGYQFATTGWRPGQYQLVLNCDAGGRYLFHMFELKAKPGVMIFN